MEAMPVLRAVLLVAALIAIGAVPVAAAATYGEDPTVQWQKLLGGSGIENARSIQQTSDGGCILLGYSDSSESGNVTGTNHGGFDHWVVKLNSTGTIQWQKLVGGSGIDWGIAVQQTSDGGYVLFGASDSSASGDVTGTNHGGDDYWVVKLNSTGTIQWQELLGGSGYDYGRSVQQTADGGYILLGYSDSSESGDITGANRGGYDDWVVKLNSTGAIQWQKLLGGSGNEYGESVRQTADGGYILFGYSSSSESGDVTGTINGGDDYWVVKLSSTGAIQWQQLLGGSGDDYGVSVQQTSDGGYVLLGSSSSSASGDVTGTNHGQYDYWVVKLSSTGEVQWQELLGGSQSDYGKPVRQTADGGYILLGDSSSSATGDVTGTNHGSYDHWVVKLSSTGTIQWQKLLGGSRDDYGYSAQQASDGGYILLGESSSSASGDVTDTNHGNNDVWIVKLAPAPAPPVVVLPGGTSAPTDPNGDGKYEDVNGNGRPDFADVVLFFNQMGWIADHEPEGLFDYNGNGRIDFADVVWLFNHL